MSKRNLYFGVMALVLAISSNAFASRARQVVLGSGDPLGVLSTTNHGSFYYDDNMNMFYNPSYANDFKNWAAFEKNNGNNTMGQAEGGFVAGFGNFAVGAYMNRGGAIYDGGLNGAYTAANVALTRPIEVVIAGDMGVKWGLLVSHGNYKPAVGTNIVETSARLGAQIMDFEPFVAYKIKGTNVTANTETEIGGWNAGLRYKFGEWTPYLAARRDWQDNVPAGTNKRAQTSSIYGIGVGRSMKATESTRLMYAVGFFQGFRSNRTGVVADTIRQDVLPIDVSVESDFASWVTGRAGLGYQLINRTNKRSTAAANAATSIPGGAADVRTTARMGASFHFGKVDVDWAVGTRAAGGGFPGAGAQQDDTEFDFASGLFSQASLTYRW